MVRILLTALALLPLVAACAPGEAVVDDGHDAMAGPAHGASPKGSDSGDGGDQELDVPPGVDPHANTYVPPGWSTPDAERIIFLGDSITAGSGASKDRRAYRNLLLANDDDKWPGSEALELPAILSGDPEVIDVSFGGATTGSLVRFQLPDLKKKLGDTAVQGTTVVIMTIGGNDAQTALLPWSDADDVIAEAQDNLLRILDWLQDTERFAGDVRIYLTNIYEPSDGVGKSKCFLSVNYADKLGHLDAFNDELRELGAEREFAVLDLRGHFSGHGFNRQDDTVFGHDPNDTSVWFAGDCIHPNDRGHHELRRMFFHAVAGEDLPAPDAL